MDSWTLQGDSYSFLRSAPRTFSLRHRDGTPNHVEIFDIINVPSQRSAISETTCLCDIFGDDCESPSLPSSPAVGAFVPSQTEAGASAAASPVVDDLNDSSGSYHTAQGSSEGEDGFEDSRERLCSPQLQCEPSEGRQPEGEERSSGHPDVSMDSSPNLEPQSKSPLPQLSTGSPSSEAFNTPSPGHNSPYTLSPEGRSSSLSSSSVEKRCSPSSPNPRRAHLEVEPQRITPSHIEPSSPSHQSLTQSPSPEPRNSVSPSSSDSVNTQSLPESRVAQVSPEPRSSYFNQHNSPSHQYLTPSPSPEPRNCVSSSSSESLNTQSLPEFRVAQVSPEPRSSCFNQHNSPSPEPTSKGFSLDFTESVFESSPILSSPLPLSRSAELSTESEETLVSPELKKRPYSPDTQASSPFPELRRRVSLPDLFSRGSTPDSEDFTHTPELISNPSSAERDTTNTPESHHTRLSAEPASSVSTPAPRYTPPSPVISIATSPELVESSVSPELGHTAPSPGLLSAASPTNTGARTPSSSPSHHIRHLLTPSEIGTQVSSPVVSYSLSPSPEVTSNCSPIEHRHTAPSPEIRITASSPEVSNRDWSSEVEISDSLLLESHSDSASSRSLNCSPRITGISYSVIQFEDRDTVLFPELSHLSTPEPDRTPVSPAARSPTSSRDSLRSSIAESTGTPRDSSPQPEIALSHQPRYQTPSPQPKHYTYSPEPRYKTPSSDKHQSPLSQHSSKDPSPVAPSPEQRYHQHSPAILSTDYNSQYTQPTPPRNTPEGDSSVVDNTEIQYPTHLAKEKEETPKEANLQENSSLAFSEETQAIGPNFIQKEDTYNNPPIEVRSPSPISTDRSPNCSLAHRATSNVPVQRLENSQPQFTYSLNSESSSSLKSACTPEQTRRELSPSVRRENRERFTEDMAHHVNKRRTPSPPLTRFTPVHIIAPEKPYRQWQNRSHSASQVVASSQSGNLKKVVTNRESPNVAPADNNSQAHWVRLGTQLELEREMQLEEDRKVGRERQSDREIERERKWEEQVPEKGRGWQGDASYRGEQVDLSFNARNRKGPASRSAAPTSRETRQGLPTVHSYSESLLASKLPLQQQQSLLRLASQQHTRAGGPSRRLQPPAAQKKNRSPGRVAANRPCRSSSSSMGSELDEADNEVKWFTDLAFRSLSSPEVDYLDMYNSSHRSSTNISQPSTQESPAGVNAAWLAYADFRGSAQKLDNDELSFHQPPAYYSDGLDPSRRYEMGSFECVDVAMEREDPRKVRKGVPKRQIQLKRKDHAEGKPNGSSENSSPGVPVMVESPTLESHSRETFVRQHSTPATMQECYPSGHSPEPSQQNDRKSRLQKSVSLDETCTKTKMATCLIKSVLSKKMQSVDKQPDEQAGEDVSPTFKENSPPTETAVSPLKESLKPHIDTRNLVSSLQSNYSLSPEGLPVRGESITKDEAKPPKSFGMRSSNRPSSSSSNRSVTFSQTESEEADSQSRNATSLKYEMRSELKVPFDSKELKTGIQQEDDSKTWNEREGDDSANATAGNTSPSATGASSAQARVTNKDQECENTEDHKQLQQSDKDTYASKTQEITLKTVGKKKASLNVCLTPEAESKPAFSPDMFLREKEERVETSVDEKIEKERGNGKNQVKAPIHKVRDVRRLVKNTYNLSFKATSAAMPSNDIKERMEPFNQESGGEIIKKMREEVIAGEEKENMEEEFRMDRKEEQKENVKDSKLLTLCPPLQNKTSPPTRPQPMQIEYKAVCWKEDKTKMLCVKKDSDNTGLSLQASETLVTEVGRESSNANKQNYTGNTAIAKPCQHDLNVTAETQETMAEIHQVPDNEDKLVVVRTDRKSPMLGNLPKLPSKEREVSTAVVLIKDGSSKTKTSQAQEEIPTPLQAPATSPGPTTPSDTPGSGHSVSMLLKEKGYQADIGAMVGDNQIAAGGKGLPHKHVNCLEIPLQTPMPSDGGQTEPHRERLSSSLSTSGPLTVSDTITKTRDDEVVIKPTVKDTAKQKSASLPRNTQEQTPPPTKQKELGDFEAVKRLDPTFPPRSPAIRRFRPQPIEVKSLSKETQKQEIPTNSTGKNRPQTIEVKSIAKNSQKPAVPPKPSCKFKTADLGTMPNEAQRSSVTASTIKPQGEERPQTIVVSSPTIYRKISNESTSTSNYTRKLAVSAVCSLKPPPCKPTATTMSNLSSQSTAPSETEASNDRDQQQKPGALPQRPLTLATAPPSATGPDLTSAPVPVSDSNANQVPAPASVGANQPCQPAVTDPDSQPQNARMEYPHEQAMPVTLSNTTSPTAVSTTQVPGYTHQPCHRSLSSERSQRTDDLHFYASDDPPSYDERESFSPLMLPDLTPRRSNRYQPSSRPPLCSCTAGCPSHPGITPPHHYRSPHNHTPPAPPHSPGQALPYPVAQPPLRPHQCRPDTQPMSYQPGSPKSSHLGPSQPPAMYQPLHQPPPCPTHPSLMPACPTDRPLQPPQHTEPRRPPVHRSPQQQPQGMAPFSDPGHSHSPSLPPMDPQYLCGPQSLGPSYGSEYGGDSASLYSESSYGQTPRRVLLDPETGKYFYIEVPVQPLRKMLFDPETGQYVEVLIPQQAMPHSGLYPPSAAPYPPLHNPNMYSPATQYMPYAAPLPPVHPQAQPQPPRHPEASAAATMHPSGPGVNYRNPTGQGSKPEPQNHPPLDQSYLESMYYVPTGMNASPNPTPPDYYHKHPPNLPPTGGKRS